VDVNAQYRSGRPASATRRESLAANPATDDGPADEAIEHHGVLDA
jgi:hypothetical protein